MVDVEIVSWRGALAQRRTDPVGTRAVAKRLRDEAEESGDSLALARALIVDGGGAWASGAYDEAMRALHGALRLLDELGDTDSVVEERAAALSELGVAAFHVGDHARALDHLRVALDVRTAQRDEAGQAELLNRIGMVLYHRGELASSKLVYEDAIAILAERGSPEDLAGAHNNIAKVLMELGDHAAAGERLARACRLWEAVDERRGLSMALTNAGILHSREGDTALASLYFEASLALKQTIHDPYGECETRRLLGRLRIGQDRVEEGIVLLERALAEAEAVGLRDEVAQACEALAEAHERAGAYSTALAWHRRFHTVDREVYDTTSDLRLRHLQVAYQLDRAEREGNTDALTGLANRRHLDRRLADELVLARDAGTEVGLALLDLDSFKLVNDEFSHAVGDTVLREVAGLLREHVRAGDVAARYGGEEFAVVLPGCDLDQTIGIARQLCAAIRDHDWDAVHPGVRVTTSVGVAVAGGRDAAAVMAHADQNLYAAKNSGKDHVVA